MAIASVSSGSERPSPPSLTYSSPVKQRIYRSNHFMDGILKFGGEPRMSYIQTIHHIVLNDVCWHLYASEPAELKLY